VTVNGSEQWTNMQFGLMHAQLAPDEQWFVPYLEIKRGDKRV